MQAARQAASAQERHAGLAQPNMVSGHAWRLSPRDEQCQRSADLFRQQLHRTLVETSLPMLLRYEDRNSMAHSIESRVPFLIPGLADFLLRLPEEYLIGPDGTSKRIFRDATRGFVPDAILDRKDKIGFATPEQTWLTTLRPWAEKILHGDTARSIRAVRWPGLARGMAADDGRHEAFRFPGLAWVNLILWAERFDVGFA